ncbi:MAG: 1-acyl-sn-glycerol-3-phosphate acyltransferase [Candidatus Vogelbacteria bacterium]|nr:1-acyl-sn-glycerol-3-phosphate acyltransferase [Candidatus Vogelbacteria bacterium]
MKQALPYIFEKLVWAPLRILFIFFVRLRIRGAENLANVDGSHGVILASNHITWMDPFLVSVAPGLFSPLYPIFYMAMSKEHYRSMPFFRYIIGDIVFSVLGGISTPLGTGDYDVALKDHVKLLRRGGTLLMFPEGQRTPDGKLHEGKPGIGYLVEKTGAVIIPIAITGSFGLTPSRFFLRKHRIEVRIGRTFLNHRDRVYQKTKDDFSKLLSISSLIINEIGLLGDYEGSMDS